jgi:hypothetical protein
MLWTAALALWCVGFGYFIRDWLEYDSWQHRARAVFAAVLWPVLLVVLLLSGSPPEEEPPWEPPPPPPPPEKSLFPDDDW